MFQLTLLRHGISTGNQDGLRQGQLDFPLSEAGYRQAERLAARWLAERRSFDLILSSPLSRARQTSQILSKALGAPVELDDGWLERHAGVAQGLPVADEDLPPVGPGENSIYQPLFEGGESILDLHLRAASAVQDLMNRPPGRYLVVSHGGILSATLLVIIGLAPSARAPRVRLRFDNTGYADLRYELRSQVWTIDAVNDTRHLQGEEDG